MQYHQTKGVRDPLVLFCAEIFLCCTYIFIIDVIFGKRAFAFVSLHRSSKKELAKHLHNLNANYEELF